jgi:hypothetical protein
MPAVGRKFLPTKDKKRGGRGVLRGLEGVLTGNEDPTSHLLTRKAHAKNAAGSIALFGLTVLLLAINGIAMHAICPACNEQCIELMV